MKMMRGIVAAMVLAGVLGCNHVVNPTVGGDATPPAVAGSGPSVAKNASKVKVGMAYRDVLDLLGKPERIYGAGTPVLVYAVSKDVQLKVGIKSLDMPAKVLWVKRY